MSIVTIKQRIPNHLEQSLTQPRVCDPLGCLDLYEEIADREVSISATDCWPPGERRVRDLCGARGYRLIPVHEERPNGRVHAGEVRDE